MWGVVFSVSPQDLERLDQFEGVAQGAYQRERLEVLDQNGQSHSAWAYFAVPENPPEEYKPAKDYLGLFIQGAEHFGLPGYYVQELQMIESTD